MLFGLFGGKSYNPDRDIPDLSGKVFIVTGGNAGLGQETCLQLAKHRPGHIYLAARTASKAEDAIKSIKSAVPDANITHLPLDLTSFESVKSAVNTFKAASSRLDVLVNNAGIMATPPGETKEGYEIQFGTNHMGHALLTKLLLPTLQATAKEHGDARIVNLSSEGHNLARDGLMTDKAKMDAVQTWTRYGNSKLANILFARSLSQKYPEITSVSLHPGLIYTDLYGSSIKKHPILKHVATLVTPFFFKSVAKGAYNQIWAATCPKSEVENGAYYELTGDVSKGGPHAQSQEEADELWAFTEKELAGHTESL